eukprot:TRINITY_DN15789_c0_g1_i1.p1 TRINITY_DN15789_c0_g1~~TRINITY_DN15789_c0_g1_i1.p1  ORF type:complete len:409 (+),score=62.05 TRINITY_DN15789_c0_g1_i1:55-1227(+)
MAALAAMMGDGSDDKPREEVETVFRLSRTYYPGSKFGPKTRYDLPRRHKAYGNGDEAEAVLFAGTSLQPTLAAPMEQTKALTDAARSMLHPLAQRNLPELPLLDDKNSAHGILIWGGKGAGKTSLVMSLWAVATGSYPGRQSALEQKRHTMPTYGQCYEFPEEYEVTLGSGSVKAMKVVLTDTPPCGTGSGENPICTRVSPNSAHQFNTIPSWMRITVRTGNFPHYSVIIVIDGTATPLWEDSERCRDLARLLSVLKRNQYTVVIAVTKLLQARQAAVRETNYGADHGGQVGKDPRSSYEAYVSRFIEKTCAAIRAKASENEWSFSQGPDAPAFPLMGSTVFDVPTYSSIGEYKRWQEATATIELPNRKYITSQLSRLLTAACTRSHPDC